MIFSKINSNRESEREQVFNIISCDVGNGDHR